MMLGEMCAYNEGVDAARYERMSEALGAGHELMSVAVRGLRADLGLTSRLRDFGVQKDDYEVVVGLALRSDNVLANPRAVGPEELRQLLEQAQ
jgi:alcohol dehydrogenase